MDKGKTQNKHENKRDRIKESVNVRRMNKCTVTRMKKEKKTAAATLEEKEREAR